MLNSTADDPLIDGRVARGLGGRFYGVHPALVTDVVDPEAQGRVEVRLPWTPDTDGAAYEAWARIATLFAGGDRGSWFQPDVGDEVLVAFEAGDVRRPYVVGGLWNGKDAPPENMDAQGRNNLKTLRTRSGVQIAISDKNGEEQIKLETPGGQTVLLRDGQATVELQDRTGNSVTLDAGGITIRASTTITVEASTVNVSASMVKVDAGMSKFSGVLQADTVISNAVISTSYTPGAGNIL